MSKFILGVFEAVVKEYHTSMIVTDMYISRVMVHVHKINQEKLKKKSIEAKRDKTRDGNCHIQGLMDTVVLCFDKCFWVNLKFNVSSKFKKYSVHYTYPHGVNGSGFLFPTCAKCGCSRRASVLRVPMLVLGVIRRTTR